MRSDAEIKNKIADLLAVEGEEKERLLTSLNEMSVEALKTGNVDTHSVRGMLSALYWMLGYSFNDIREHLVERSLTRDRQPGRETMQSMKAVSSSD
jgi:hypothetical protein